MSNLRRTLPTLATLGAAVVLGGCGVSDPYTARNTTTASTSTTTAAPTEPGPAGAGPRALVRDYAQLSINWTSRTLAADQRRLARLASAGARAQALQTAASYGPASSLARSHVANRGQITSIAEGQGLRHGWWIVTTQETSTGTGDYQHLPTQAHIYAARLTHAPTGWTVSTWSPQN